MTIAEIHADIAEFRAMLHRIPMDRDPDNAIARQIYEGLIEERLALARALERDSPREVRHAS